MSFPSLKMADKTLRPTSVKKLRINIPVVLLLLAVVLVVFVRVRLLATPLERDEGEFAYGGQLMLQGIPPYKLFYNMKFPGIYAAYALCMFLFGQTPSGIHFGLLVVNVACVLLLYRLARRFLDVSGAAAAAASYALLSTSPVVLGLAAHATHFVVLAALAGLLVLLRGEDSGKGVLFFWSGVLFGVSCLMKQPGAMFGLFGFCLLVAQGAQEREQWRAHRQRIVLYFAGAGAPLVLTGVILWQAGVFQRFWFWTVVYAKAHAAEFGWSAGLRQLAWFFRHIPYGADGLFWILGGLGLVSLLSARCERRKRFWLAGFLVISFVAVSLAKYFSEHYFVMLLPALCLLVGEAVSVGMGWAVALSEKLEERSSSPRPSPSAVAGMLWRDKPGEGEAMAAGCCQNPQSRKPSGTALRGVAWTALPGALFVLVWGLTVFHHRADFFVLSPERFCKEFYYPNSFVECQQVGRYLREHAAPDARIAVLGSEPEILFYAGRHSATGYIYMYDFFVPQPYAAGMQHEMIAQIEEARPEYLVFVKQWVSWDLRGHFEELGSSPVMTWLPKFVGNFYEPVGVVLLKPEPEYYWGQEALDRTPQHDPFIGVLKRK
ncbi:MAG: glycosyltransferase family 39 protein [Verrucomicrobiota bacterium]|jgi:hypothetical protein